MKRVGNEKLEVVILVNFFVGFYCNGKGGDKEGW